MGYLLAYLCADQANIWSIISGNNLFCDEIIIRSEHSQIAVYSKQRLVQEAVWNGEEVLCFADTQRSVLLTNE